MAIIVDRKVGVNWELVLHGQILAAGLPVPSVEMRFHPVRRWRFDIAFVEQRLAVEIQGGVWRGGRHTSGSGYSRDAERLAEAQILGWRLLYVTPDHIKSGQAVDWIRRALA